MNAWKLIVILSFACLSHVLEAQSSSATAPVTASSKVSGELLLSIYAEASGRTVLRPTVMAGGMHSTNLNIFTDTNRILVNIEAVLAENGFEMTRIGESFVRVMQASGSNSPTKIALDKITPPKDVGNKIIPGGEVNFPSVDLDVFLNVYADFKKRTILRSATLPWVLFTLRTQKPVSKEELIYAMETLMVLNGLVALEDGDKFVKVVPLSLESQIKASAPKPNDSGKVIEPKNVPALKDPIRFRTPARPPQTLSQEITNFSAKAYTKAFGHPPGALPDPMADRLVEYYAELADKRYTPSPIGKKRILFEARTSLTKEELMYAIETTLRLNDLRIIEIDEKTIGLGPVQK